MIKEAFSRFSKFSDEEWSEVEACFTYKKLVKGDHLVKPMQVSKSLAFVTEGLLSYYYISKGNQRIRQFFFSNNFAGDLSSYFLESPSDAYIEAIENSTVVLINKTDSDMLIENNVAYRTFMLKATQYLLTVISEKYESFLLKTAEERYVDLIHDRPKVIHNVPQYMIASYLGITQEGLSRIRRRLSIK